MDELAINGGKPVRKEKIYYGGQYIDKEDVQSVAETLVQPLITCGPRVQDVERQLERVIGVKHASVVSSGTAALHCACLAAEISEGDEVITSPFTFAASANCILYCGGKPVFADIDPETYNISPESIEKHITDRTKAIIAVDYAGQAVEHDRIREICDKYGLVFIEDAAHALGTKYDDKMIGSLADMTCFSFHPVKTVTAGEGGAVTTNNDRLHKKIVLAHLHGITHEEQEMECKEIEGSWYYEQVFLGYNYRMTDFQAALLSSQLKKLDWFIKRRREIEKEYDEVFADCPGLILQKDIKESSTCRHLYTIRLDQKKLNCSRRLFFDSLSAENIQPQVHYIPVYWFPYYRRLGYNKGLCPNAEEVYSSIMSIPLYPKMKDEDVHDVICAVRKLVEFYGKTT